MRWLRRYGFYLYLPLCLLALGLSAVLLRQRLVRTVGPAQAVRAASALAQSALCDPLSPGDPYGFPAGDGICLSRLGQWQAHPGTDLFCEAGTPVYAMHEGEVSSMEETMELGCRLVLTGEAEETVYACLGEQSPLKPGDRVRQGQLIGYVGESGLDEPRAPHLHLEVTAPPPESR